MLECKQCGKSFKNEKALYGHMAKCGKPKANTTSCPICKKEITVFNIDKHIKMHSGDKKCLTCGERIDWYKTFCSHTCSAKHSNSLRRKIKNCLICGNEINASGRKYCSHECSVEARRRETDKLFEQGLSFSQNTLRTKMKRLYIYECSICGVKEWNGKSLVLQVDHIDGNSLNNNPENLRFVCPNCDSQLPTYKGRNKNSSRTFRVERYVSGKTY